jgi:hypothetical protein
MHDSARRLSRNPTASRCCPAAPGANGVDARGAELADKWAGSESMPTATRRTDQVRPTESRPVEPAQPITIESLEATFEASSPSTSTAGAGEGHGHDHPTLEQIAAEAYAIYMANGESHGHDINDWLEAERRLRERKASRA